MNYDYTGEAIEGALSAIWLFGQKIEQRFDPVTAGIDS